MKKWLQQFLLCTLVGSLAMSSAYAGKKKKLRRRSACTSLTQMVCAGAVVCAGLLPFTGHAVQALQQAGAPMPPANPNLPPLLTGNKTDGQPLGCYCGPCTSWDCWYEIDRAEHEEEKCKESYRRRVEAWTAVEQARLKLCNHARNEPVAFERTSAAPESKSLVNGRTAQTVVAHCDQVQKSDLRCSSCPACGYAECYAYTHRYYDRQKECDDKRERLGEKVTLANAKINQICTNTKQNYAVIEASNATASEKGPLLSTNQNLTESTCREYENSAPARLSPQTMIAIGAAAFMAVATGFMF